MSEEYRGERTREEKLKALIRKDVDPEIIELAKRALRRRQEESRGGRGGAVSETRPWVADSTGEYCPSCGEPVDAGDLFCRHCGGELPPESVEE